MATTDPGRESIEREIEQTRERLARHDRPARLPGQPQDDRRGARSASIKAYFVDPYGRAAHRQHPQGRRRRRRASLRSSWSIRKIVALSKPRPLDTGPWPTRPRSGCCTTGCSSRSTATRASAAPPAAS